jgi:glycosyltransferase 2 family protein
MKVNTKAVVGIVISIALLWWTLRDVSFAHVLDELRRADPVLFSLAVFVATLGLVTRAIRWLFLLRPLSGGMGFRPPFAATSIGFAANNVLPARVGEFARALALNRLTRVSIPAAFSGLVIERVLDGLVIIAFLFLAISSPGFPSVTQLGGFDPRAAANFMLFGVAVVGIALFLLVVAPARSTLVLTVVAERVLPRSFRRPVVDALASFIRGIGALRSPRLFAISLAGAVGQWLLLAWSYHLALLAFGIEEVEFMGAVFVQSIVSLAVAIPSSPGFFGPFEAAAKLSLSLWNVAPEKAVSFAVGFHIGGFIPVTVIGLYYFWALGLRWSEVEQSEEVVEGEVEAEVEAEAAVQSDAEENAEHDEPSGREATHRGAGGG